MREQILYYGRISLIVAELMLLGFLGYAAKITLPTELGRFVSLDVLYCLPIIQTARMAAIHATRSSDTQTTTLIGIAAALILSASEALISASDFPLEALALNTFSRSVVFTLIGRVIVKLWREREYAHKDLLTGLANRVELVERLEIEQVRSERTGRPYSLLYIDIDHFKELNDSQGHHAGDEALKALACTLRDCARKVDVVSRIGGDEFVLLLPDTDAGSCKTLIERIEASTEQIFQGRLWPISVSIGSVNDTGKAQKVDWLIRLADENMYEAKKAKQQRHAGSGQNIFLGAHRQPVGMADVVS